MVVPVNEQANGLDWTWWILLDPPDGHIVLDSIY